jgi:quinohemoprotein ethanol dehydrogenase
MHGGDWTDSRHSELATINRRNVNRLGLAWSFDDFVVRGRTHRGMQSTPIVMNGVMYVTGPWSVIYALNARTGELLWQHDPQVPGGWARKACCDAVNRGVAVANDKVFSATLDGYLLALDARTGRTLWRTDTFIDRERAYTITGAPRLTDKLVVIGNAGGELGVRGYVSAYERDSGKLAWRFFTVPGSGADEHPEIATARKSWSRDSRFDFGLGGTVWDSMSFDPELQLLYVGVGNGSPWPAWVRSPGGGDNLYLSSILALDAGSGRLRWHYQTTPADSWDYTATQNMILADLKLDGRARKVLMQAPKNGFYYVLDRETGELLSARAYTDVTWASRVDPATGRPVTQDSARYQDRRAVVVPSIAGGHNWQPMAFSPRTQLTYIPVLAEQMTFVPWRDGYRRDTINVEARVDDPAKAADRDPLLDPQIPAPHSALVAWNPVTAQSAWRGHSRPWWSGGVLSTAGDLVAQGGSDGLLVIHDALDGRELKTISVGTAISAAPISYSIDGTQYIAVVAGLGGSVKTFPWGSAALDYQNSERLLVFRLDGGPVPLPPRLAPKVQRAALDASSIDAATAARGSALFLDHCSRCHAPSGAANNYPDLWNLPAATYGAFEGIVLGGAMEHAGMPRFDDALSPADVAAIRDFIIRDDALSRVKR